MRRDFGGVIPEINGQRKCQMKTYADAIPQAAHNGVYKYIYIVNSIKY